MPALNSVKVPCYIIDFVILGKIHPQDALIWSIINLGLDSTKSQADLSYLFGRDRVLGSAKRLEAAGLLTTRKSSNKRIIYYAHMTLDLAYEPKKISGHLFGGEKYPVSMIYLDRIRKS